jgi:secondary thiamine-phosphate synthase enzyme
MSRVHQERLSIATGRQGLHDMTAEVRAIVARSGVGVGLATVFIRHTSASLIINENADPDVCTDLEAFFQRLVPEGDPLYRHTDEGPDDMPAHVKSALTATALTIPVDEGRMLLGTWQGIYVWEHRRHATRRNVVVHVAGEPE